VQEVLSTGKGGSRKEEVKEKLQAGAAAAAAAVVVVVVVVEGSEDRWRQCCSWHCAESLPTPASPCCQIAGVFSCINASAYPVSLYLPVKKFLLHA
jgi:hypothetical protein